MSTYPVIPAFDLQPRDTLCQCVELLRSKWQPQRLLGPSVPVGAGRSGSWELPQEREWRQENLRREWRKWLRGEQSGLLAGHVLAVTTAAARGAFKEVALMDGELDQRVEPGRALASRKAGSQLLLACDGLLHGGVLSRLQQQWMRGGSCHWGTAWGALTALFSMPPAGAALVALFSEWEALEPVDRRDRSIGEAVAAFARDSGPSLAKCQWIETRVRQAFLRIA